MPHWNEPLPRFLFDEPPNFLFDEPPKRRGSPWLAWVVIVAVLAGSAWVRAHRVPRRGGIGQQDLDAVSLATARNEWLARLTVGRAQLFPPQRQQLLHEVAARDQGTLSQRLRNVVLVGELGGPKSALVMAPIVEETMFRGVLHRHLRDATAWLGYAASALASATVASLMFAAIHPQGWIAAPILMSLAFAFTLFREWRGTLVPAMVAHSISNGLVMWLLIAIAGK